MFTKKSLIVSGALILGLACTGIAATYAQTVTPAAKRAAAIPLQMSNRNLLNILSITHYLGDQELMRGSGLSRLVGDLEHLLIPGSQITSMPLMPTLTSKPSTPASTKKHIKSHPVRKFIRPVSKSGSSSNSASSCSKSAQSSGTQQKQSTCPKQPAVEAQQPGKLTPVATQQASK